MSLPPPTDYWKHEWIDMKCGCVRHYYGSIWLGTDGSKCMRHRKPWQ